MFSHTFKQSLLTITSIQVYDKIFLKVLDFHRKYIYFIFTPTFTPPILATSFSVPLKFMTS